MDANVAILTRKRPPVSVLGKTSRAFKPSSMVLEPRALMASFRPSMVGVPARSALVSLLTPPAPQPPGEVTVGGDSGYATIPNWSGSGFHGSDDRGPDDRGPDGKGLTVSPGTVGPEPDRRSKNRVGLAAAEIKINGQQTPEFALADADRGIVLVKVGFEGGPTSVLTAADGINGPGSIVLQDVNKDDIPDLVIANAGGDNVLVFPGLVGGGVGPEVSGGRGFAVGRDPVSLTIGDVDGDGLPDLVVANKGSNNVTILIGHGAGANWTIGQGAVLIAGDAPVRTELQDIDSDGKPELFILNSVSNDVTVYRRLDDGTFELFGDGPIAVGSNPSEMFVGRFDLQTGYDLVTVNSGSHDLSYIADVGTIDQHSVIINSGGIQPITAFASDLNSDGVLDMVVAGVDGRLAVLQGGQTGLELSGVIDRPAFASPTALAAGNAGGSFYAAGSQDDLAQILSFNLALSPESNATPVDFIAGDGEINLVANLLPFDDSGVGLIAVLWEDGRSNRSQTSEVSQREAASPVPCVKLQETEADQEDQAEADEVPLEDLAPAPEDPDAWARYVLGLDEALDEHRDLLLALAEPGEETLDDRSLSNRAELQARPPVDPTLEDATQAVDEALRSLRSEVEAPSDPDDDSNKIEGAGTPSRRIGISSVPTLASSILLASRLILQASPPRPPSIRRGAGRRIVRIGPGEDRPTLL